MLSWMVYNLKFFKEVFMRKIFMMFGIIIFCALVFTGCNLEYAAEKIEEQPPAEEITRGYTSFIEDIIDVIFDAGESDWPWSYV